MTEKITRYQNSEIHYTVAGKGVPVMLVHGFAEDSNVWQYQQEELSEQYLVIIPDLPGSGKSGMIDNMSTEGLADCLYHIVCQELHTGGSAGNLIMIGHSMGGYIVLAFAEKYPERLLGLGLFHSTAFADSEDRKATRRRGIAFIQTYGSAAFIKESTPNLFTAGYRIKNSPLLAEMIVRYSSFDPLALTAYYQAMIQRPDRTTVLQSFNKPILFIIGKNDKAIPFEDSMKQCHIPAAAYINVLAHSAHMGMWEEKEESRLALFSFLQDAAI